LTIIFLSTICFSKQTIAAQKKTYETVTIECDASCMQIVAEGRRRSQAFENYMSQAEREYYRQVFDEKPEIISVLLERKTYQNDKALCEAKANLIALKTTANISVMAAVYRGIGNLVPKGNLSAYWDGMSAFSSAAQASDMARQRYNLQLKCNKLNSRNEII